MKQTTVRFIFTPSFSPRERTHFPRSRPRKNGDGNKKTRSSKRRSRPDRKQLLFSAAERRVSSPKLPLGGIGIGGSIFARPFSSAVAAAAPLWNPSGICCVAVVEDVLVHFSKWIYSVRRACSISSRISSMFSIPIESRINSGVRPPALCCSSESWLCDVLAG